MSSPQVINFTMPNTTKHYVHRVGRTARAGRAGRSVSLVGEEERKMLKEIVKTAKMPVKARILPQGICLARTGLQTRSSVRMGGAEAQTILTRTMCVFLSGPHWVCLQM